MVARWTVLMTALAGFLGGCSEDGGGTPLEASAGAESEVAVMAIDYYAPTITAGATRPILGRAERYLVSTVAYPGAEWVDITMRVILANGYRYELWAGRGPNGSVVECQFTFPELGMYTLEARASYWSYPGYYQHHYNSGWSYAWPVEVIPAPRRPQKPVYVSEP